MRGGEYLEFLHGSHQILSVYSYFSQCYNESSLRKGHKKKIAGKE